MPDHVVIADIAGQALDIFVHGPESAYNFRKNGIVKTFTHTSNPIHPCTLITQRAKPYNSLNVWPSFCRTLPVQCGGACVSSVYVCMRVCVVCVSLCIMMCLCVCDRVTVCVCERERVCVCKCMFVHQRAQGHL